MSIRIDVATLKETTNTVQERNIYIHPNALARDIFWQRLEGLFHYIQKHVGKSAAVLDFGGGSGVFSKSLCGYFNHVELIDIDPSCAENIKQRFSLENLNIISGDIRDFHQDKIYDLIIAADVLEHFEDLSIPMMFIRDHLKENGLLMVSLPTENLLYEAGRKIVKKKKPDDHYHTSKEVISFLEQHDFKIIEKTYKPRYLIAVPLFELVVFTKLTSH